MSYRFIAYMDRDSKGKQIRRYMTWTPPANLTPARAKNQQNAPQHNGRMNSGQSIKRSKKQFGWA